MLSLFLIITILLHINFKKDTFQNSLNLGSMTSMVLQSLYSEAAPIILTTTSFRTILEYAELYEDMLNQVNFNTIISKYNTSLYNSTMLNDFNFLTKLSQFSQLIQKFYDQINLTIKETLNVNNNPIDALKIINDKYNTYKYQNLKALLKNTMDQFIWITSFELLKVFLIIEKLKLGRWEIRQINEFLILAIPQRYVDRVKRKTLQFFKDQNIPYDLAKGFNETALGIAYENLPIVKNPFNSISYKYIDEAQYLDTFQKSLIPSLSKLFTDKLSLKSFIKSQDKDVLGLFSEEYIWNRSWYRSSYRRYNSNFNGVNQRNALQSHSIFKH